MKEYLELLKTLVEQNPEALEYEVFYSIDDEGNGYNEVFYEPSICRIEDNEMQLSGKYNAVCLN